MDSTEKPGYWAVIPASVRYDERIKPNAKLLFGEISALCNSLGYCYAGNEYFAALYGLTDRTVRSLISQLADAGYITVDIQKDAKGQVSGRKIIAFPAANIVRNPEEEIFRPEEENFQNPEEEIFRNNNTSNINNTPKAPKGGERGPSQPKHLPDLFEQIWKSYSQHARNPGNRKRAVRAWDKLKPDEALVQTMCKALRRQYKTDWWQRDVGVPHFSTWLNDARWEDPFCDSSEAACEPLREGWD